MNKYKVSVVGHGWSFTVSGYGHGTGPGYILFDTEPRVRIGFKTDEITNPWLGVRKYKDKR